jgi:hypothetical protein
MLGKLFNHNSNKLKFINQRACIKGHLTSDCSIDQEWSFAYHWRTGGVSRVTRLFGAAAVFVSDRFDNISIRKEFDEPLNSNRNKKGDFLATRTLTKSHGSVSMYLVERAPYCLYVKQSQQFTCITCRSKPKSTHVILSIQDKQRNKILIDNRILFQVKTECLTGSHLFI